MPAVNPRITITLTPSLHALLRRLSELTGNSQSAIVGELLGASTDVFERMVGYLEAAEKLSKQGHALPQEVRKSLEEAQERISTQLGLGMDVVDGAAASLLAEAEQVTRRGPRAGAERRRGGSDQPLEPPISNRGVTPSGKAEIRPAKRSKVGG